MRRPSQAQKRIMNALFRCFVCHIDGQAKLFFRSVVRADRAASRAMMTKCGLCRFGYRDEALDRAAHAMAHYAPIKAKVEQIEVMATMAGGDSGDYHRAVTVVMGWSPCTAEATAFFRNQEGVMRAGVTDAPPPGKKRRC